MNIAILDTRSLLFQCHSPLMSNRHKKIAMQLINDALV